MKQISEIKMAERSWEYFGYRFANITELDTFPNRMEIFNTYGSEGWELVAVSEGVAYFKRLKKRDINNETR